MKTTDKSSCRALIEVLSAHGVKDIVVSPGSRNAPLTVAASRCEAITAHVIIDERSAAFFALGMAIETSRPVAMICTSGSAILNYGPALAEAYYRHVPLIAVSADRPSEWIDQDDSQTIHQNGVLRNIVKGSFEVDVENGTEAQSIYINRTINDAAILAMAAPRGPVHINIRLDEPLGGICDITKEDARIIRAVTPSKSTIDARQAAEIVRRIDGRRVLVIAGFGEPDKRLDEALDSFSKMADAVVMCEAQSNRHVAGAVAHIDSVLTTLSDDDLSMLKPDIVITLGGSIVSRMIKRYLRQAENIEHWHIGIHNKSVDCLMSMTLRIECEASQFFNAVSKILAKNTVTQNGYRRMWTTKSLMARHRTFDFLKSCQWSDFYAMGRLMQLMPRQWNLQLSNGTAIRYAQLFDYSAFSRIDCNRGVSGIDGSTSTAIGAHIYYDDVTVLISGDMSAQYDIGALAIKEISPRFKMIVLNNSGGGIFRFIPSTSKLEELDEYFAGPVNLPLEKLAEAYGMSYFKADSKESLDKTFATFASEHSHPALLELATPAEDSNRILNEYFNR